MGIYTFFWWFRSERFKVKLVATKGDLYLTGVKFSNLDAAFSDSGFFHGYNIVSDINPYSKFQDLNYQH